MPPSIGQVIERVCSYSPDVDPDVLQRAYSFAERAHTDQMRKSGDPYIEHPVCVSNILAEIEADPASVTAGLLHDTVEDTDASIEDIIDQFGPVIGQLVDGVTKLAHLDFRTEKQQQARNLRKMFVAMAKDPRVLLIKLCDRLHNMRTLWALPRERQQHVAEETRMIFAPLAHRMGVGRIKWELEDLSLRYLDPEAYEDIQRRLGKSREQREKEIERAATALRHRLQDADVDASVQGRPKHIYSIYQKMRTQEVGFDDIGDLMALRVIGGSLSECYSALGIVHDLWMPLAGQFTDYIAKPKSNNYQSLHTKVLGPNNQPMEVQIRTQQMHRVAEYGVAAHWRYKEGESDPDFDRYVSWMRQLLELETDLQESHEFVELLQLDLFEDQVFVFTPQGDVIDLPAGATPIDFAYRIHTDVGHNCVGAKVDGKLVPLDYELQNGEVAEIITREGSQPSRDWLEVVQSSHARSKIRRFLRQRARQENISRGRELLDSKLDELSEAQRARLDMSKLQEVAEHMNYTDVETLYAAIGYGDVAPKTVIDHLRKFATPESLAEEVALFAPSELADEDQIPEVTTDGVKGFRSYLAKCCNPLPGDEIVGYVTRGSGLAIHRSECKNLNYRAEREPERIIPLSWDSEESEGINVNIEVVAVDRVGLFSHITAVIYDLGLSIRAAQANMIDQYLARIVLTIRIHERKDLDDIISHLSDLIDVVNTRPLGPGATVGKA